MKYQEFLPGLALQDIIRNYWIFEIPSSDKPNQVIAHESLPESTLSLVLMNTPHFNGIRLLGSHLTKFSQTVFPDSIYLGIRFHPWIQIEALFPDKLALLNQIAEVPFSLDHYFLPISPEQLRPGFQDVSTLESCLLSFFKEVKLNKNNLIKYICTQLETEISITELTDSIPASIRSIQKQFKETTGLTMKQYATITRLRKTMQKMIQENKGQLELILENGYYDQAHFINSFKKIMNRSHQDFLAYHSSMEISIK